MNHNDIIDKFCENPQILKELESFTKSKDKLGFINKLIELINCDFDSARLVCDYLIDGTPLPSDLSPQEQAYNNAVAQEWLNKPKCPTCNSTILKRFQDYLKLAVLRCLEYFLKKLKNKCIVITVVMSGRIEE